MMLQWTPEQAKFLVDKIDVIVQASARVIFEEGSMRLLVVPRLEGGAGFHGREDMNDAWMVPAIADDFLDTLLLAEVLLADQLDVDLVFYGESLHVFVDLVTHRRSPLLEVEDSDAMAIEKASDGIWMADVGQRTLDNHSVETADRRDDLVRVTFDEVCHHEGLRKKMTLLDDTRDVLFSQYRNLKK
jgi:hypothetical protein